MSDRIQTDHTACCGADKLQEGKNGRREYEASGILKNSWWKYKMIQSFQLVLLYKPNDPVITSHIPNRNKHVH